MSGHGGTRRPPRTTDGTDEHSGHDTRTVRPRWAWSGLGLLLLGGVVLGLGVSGVLSGAPDVVLVVAGAAALVAGAVSALRGNLFYDTHASIAPGDVVSDLKEGGTREEPSPDARIVATGARENAMAMADTRHRLEQDRSYPRPPAAPLGAVLMVVGSVWLMIATIYLFPHDGAGDWAGVRDVAVATVVVLAAMTLRLPGRRPVAWAVSAGAAATLVLLGALADASTVVRANDLVIGLLVAVGCAVSSAKAGSRHEERAGSGQAGRVGIPTRG